MCLSMIESRVIVVLCLVIVVRELFVLFGLMFDCVRVFVFRNCCLICVLFELFRYFVSRFICREFCWFEIDRCVEMFFDLIIGYILAVDVCVF